MKFWWNRVRWWFPYRVMDARPSGYHDEGSTIYEVETYWRWRDLDWGHKVKVLA